MSDRARRRRLDRIIHKGYDESSKLLYLRISNIIKASEGLTSDDIQYVVEMMNMPDLITVKLCSYFLI